MTIRRNPLCASAPDPEVVVVPNAGNRVTRGEQRPIQCAHRRTRVAVSPGRAPSAFRMVRGERPTSVPTRAADPSRTAAYLHCAQCPRYAAPPASCGESMRCRVSPRPSTEGPGHQSLRIAPRRPGRMSQRDARRGMRSVHRDRPTHANSSLCFGSRQTPYWGAHHPQLRGVSQGPMAYCSCNVSATRPGRDWRVVPFGSGRANADNARATGARRPARTRDCKCRYGRVSAHRSRPGHVISVESDRRRLRSGGGPRTNATLGTRPP